MQTTTQPKEQSPEQSQFLAKMKAYIDGDYRIVNGEKVWNLKRTILADGPVAVNALKDEAKNAGITFLTMPTPIFSLKERPVANHGSYIFVHSSDLEDGGPQPRTVITPDDPETVKLFQNIQERYKLYGSVDKAQLVPIQLYPSPITPGKYRVWEGHRRELVIFKLLLLPEIKAQISYMSEEEAFDAAFTIHIRANLTAYDQGHYILEELMKRFPQKYPNQEAVAKNLGLTQQAISLFVVAYREIESQKAKANLSPEVTNRFVELPFSKVVPIAQAPEELKPTIINSIVEKDFSQREIKALVKEVQADPESTPKTVAEVAQKIADERALDHMKRADKETAKVERARDKVVAAGEDYPEDLMKAVYGHLGLKEKKVTPEKAKAFAKDVVGILVARAVESDELDSALLEADQWK